MRNFFQAGRLFGQVKNALFPGTLEFRAKIFTVLASAGFLISVSTALIGLANGAGEGNAAAVAFFKNEGALLADVIFGFVTVSLALGITMFL
jgi:hypothetical protein